MGSLDPGRVECYTLSMDDDTTYLIRRFTFSTDHPEHRDVIATGLTLDEAQEHCNDEATHGDGEHGPWFDEYEAE